MSLRILPDELLSTGQGQFGYSATKDSLFCGKKLYLQDTLGETNKGPALRMGSAFGALASRYHTPLSPYSDFSVEEILQSFLQSDEEIQEVKRRYWSYGQQLGEADFGNIIACELPVPSSPEEIERCGAPFNLRRAKPDMVVEIDSEIATQLRDKFNVPTLFSGRYMVDFKTAGRKDQKTLNEFNYGIQYKLYPTIWNRSRPEAQVDGTIFVVLFKYKNPVVELYYVPHDQSLTEPIVADMIELSETRRRVEYGRANAAACIEGTYPCEYLISGLCNRQNAL